MTKQLLIVEDDADDREALLIRLKRVHKFVIDVAACLQEAVARLERWHYDAVVLDIGLPDALRETVVERVKAAQPTSAIVILSGYADPEIMRRAISQSASAYLQKGKDDVCEELLSNHVLAAIENNLSCRNLERIRQAAESAVA